MRSSYYKGLNLKTRMALAVTFLFILFDIIASCLTTSYFERTFKESASSQQFALVSSLADAIDNKFRIAQNSLKAVAAAAPADAFIHPDKAQRFLDENVGLLSIFDNGISFTGKDGRLVVESPYRPNRRGKELSFREWVQKTLSGRKPYISEPYISTHNPGKPTIVMTVPIFDKKGEMAGMMAGGLDLLGENFLADLSRVKVGKAGYLFIADMNRTLVVHPDKSRIMKSTAPPGSNKVMDQAFNGFEGSGDTVTSYGVPMLLSVKHLHMASWLLGANYPQSEAYAPIHKAEHYFAIAAVTGAALFLLVTWLTMKRLMLPLEAIIRHMKQLPEKPQHEHRIEIDSMDEIGVLATEFNTMIDALDRQQEELRDQKQKIDEERALLDALINAVPDMIFFKDQNSVYQRCNEACAAIAMGLPRDQVIGRSDSELFPAELAEQFRQRDRDTMTSHQPNRHEELLRFAADRQLFVEVIKVPLHDEHGIWKGIIGIARDITERKRMEETLREREAMLRVTMASIPFDLYVIDRSGRYCMQSPVSMDLWGNVLGKRPEEVMSDISTQNRWLENNQKAISGKTVQREVDYHINNVRRHFREIVTPIRTDDGEILGVLGINIDQTERQQLEDQLIHAQKMESIGRLAGGVAHDLNNLLTPIIGYSELLQKDLLDTEAGQAKAENILKAALRAKDLVQQLLSFSRKQVMEMKAIDLKELITGFQSILRRTIRESIDIRLHLVEDQHCIRADRNQIEQVIMNLAVNAQDAIGECGVITIETAPVLLDNEYAHHHPEVKPGRYLMLAVTDDGSGMDQETRQRIFEPFFTTKGIGKGTGLGLATVYGIVKQHGGNIWVYSEPDKGTTFKCYFPLVDELPVSDQPVAHEQVLLVGKRRAILLVEDNEMIRTLVNEVLTEQGFEVLVAEDPRQALRMSEGCSLDLLITDVVMPYMTGPELHARLSDDYPGLKVLYMSGYTSNVITHQGGLDEGICYLQKPFAIAEFSRRVETLLTS